MIPYVRGVFHLFVFVYCVLSYVYRGSLCSVVSGSVCVVCLWVILSGCNKPLLRVNGGLLAGKIALVIAASGRLFAAVRAGQGDLNFRRLSYGVGGWMYPSSARRRRP